MVSKLIEMEPDDLDIPESDILCFEYSGYGLQGIRGWPNEKTMTTNHWYINHPFCGFIKAHGVSAIALSYDNEKVEDPYEWGEKAKIASKYFPVACNFLWGHELPPVKALKNCAQFNILSQKPTGEVKNLRMVDIVIHKLKRLGLSVTTDNCLGVQLGLISSCRRGKDFRTIRPDGRVDDCCFKESCFLYERDRESS